MRLVYVLLLLLKSSNLKLVILTVNASKQLLDYFSRLCLLQIMHFHVLNFTFQPRLNRDIWRCEDETDTYFSSKQRDFARCIYFIYSCLWSHALPCSAHPPRFWLRGRCEYKRSACSLLLHSEWVKSLLNDAVVYKGLSSHGIFSFSTPQINNIWLWIRFFPKVNRVRWGCYSVGLA